MQTCKSQEADEVANISQTNTCAHPRTVMIMHLDTVATDAAVIGAGRSHDLAGLAIG